ncbi:MAG: DNA polymerase III subunit delta [Ignavibacteria bacterium]|nr:DNA polymerase III subunit delta [Ignavibacteria bacterium]
MAVKSNSSSISDIPALIKKNQILPIYFLFGEDSFLIRQTAEYMEKQLAPLVGTDFDRETYYGSKATAPEILDFANSFPFSGDKKLVIVKEFEKMKDAEQFSNYIQSPADFTILILIYTGSITKFDKEHLQLLEKHGYSFEAKALKEGAVINWISEYVKSKKKNISEPDARYLADLVGESRETLKMQIDKMLTYIENEPGITLDIINSHVIASKEYTIFQLQDALVKRDKKLAMKIAFRMLEKNGVAPILYPLNKYYTGLVQVKELQEKNTRNEIAARIVGTHPYYYPNYIKAAESLSPQKFSEIFEAFLEADLSIKTTNTDEKTILTMLLTRILK